MLPQRIEGALDSPIGKPADWNADKAGECLALHVREQMIGDYRFMVSAWEPSPGELAALVCGAPVHLGISAKQHPVVQLGVGDVPKHSAIRKTGWIVSEDRDDDDRLWCRITLVVGQNHFPAGIEIEGTEQMPEATSRLMAAMLRHARKEGWIA